MSNMKNERMLRRRGDVLLGRIHSAHQSLERLRCVLAEYKWGLGSEDQFVWLSCILALTAASRGNFGVGAVLVYAGRVVAEGQNSNFTPRFRSELDAEMVALNAFERRASIGEDISRMTLYSTVECCPMCTARLITAGVGKVCFVIRDFKWGQASQLASLPSGWQELVESRGPVFSQITCAPLLAEAASAIYDIGRSALEEHIGRKSG